MNYKIKTIQTEATLIFDPPVVVKSSNGMDSVEVTAAFVTIEREDSPSAADEGIFSDCSCRGWTLLSSGKRDGRQKNPGPVYPDFDWRQALIAKVATDLGMSLGD